MNYYTSQIPPTLAEKLKEKGMPIVDIVINDDRWIPNRILIQPTYASCFDWLLSEKNISIDCYPDVEEDTTNGYCERFVAEWHFKVENISRFYGHGYGSAHTWHGAAEAAIEKALTLI